MKFPLKLTLIALLLFCSMANAEEVELKPVLFGIIAMGNIEFHRQDGGIPDNSLATIIAHPGVFSGIDINITWSQLQSERGPIETRALDDVLASVRSFNSEHPGAPLFVKLRIWGGPNAPPWIKSLEGPPILIFLNNPVTKTQTPLTVGRFWSQSYRREWSDLQHQLAKKYDSDPLIHEVSNSSCSSMTSEPFIFPGDPKSQKNMREAGYSDSAIYECLSQTASDYEAWRTTRVEYPFNPFRRTDSGKTVLDQQTTLNIMRYWRAQLGARAIISNYGLTNPGPPQLIPIMNDMRELGPPYELQIGNLQQPNWDATMQAGISLGVPAIEIWTLSRPDTILTTATPAQFSKWTDMLRNNLRRKEF